MYGILGGEPYCQSEPRVERTQRSNCQLIGQRAERVQQRAIIWNKDRNFVHVRSIHGVFRNIILLTIKPLSPHALSY
jgi:hypothetical protein